MRSSYVNRAGGLVTVHDGSDHAATLALLQRHDPDLRLVPQGLDRNGKPLYKVYLWSGPNAPAEFVLAWMDEKGNAKPLSSAILDEVQRHDRNLRGYVPPDPDHNRKHVEKIRAEGRAETMEMAREYGERIDGRKNTIIWRSQSLRRARDRVRRWQRYPELRP